jgi:MFS family permease
VPADVTEEFRLRSVAVAAFAPATLFGLAQGSMMPVIALSAFDRGASTAVAALIGSLLGIGSIVTNIPSGMLATRIGERKSMLVAAVFTVLGLSCCLVNLGHGAMSLLAYACGVLLIGSASSVYTLARQSYLTEMVPSHMRARALSTLGGTLRVGMFLGPFLGAGAIKLWGLPGAYYVSLAAIAVAGAIVCFVPDLEESDEHKAAALQVTSRGILKRYWRTFLTLGAGIVLLSAIRQTRQVVIPLWAVHIGLSPTTSSIIYGVAGGIDALTFYPAGKVMDLYGRRWVAVPCVLIMGVSFMLMPLTHGALTLACVAMIMGFGNGIGSGIVMTLGADLSPSIGRPTFLGIWRELADAGQGIGPVVLSAVTAVAGLGSGIIVSGAIGFAAAAALWVWIPRRPPAAAASRARSPAPLTTSPAGAENPENRRPLAPGRLTARPAP